MKNSIYTPNATLQAAIKKTLNLQYYPTAYCRHYLKRPKLNVFLENSSYSINTDLIQKGQDFTGYAFNYTPIFCITRSIKLIEICLFFSYKISYANYLSELFLNFLSDNKYKSYIILYPLKGNFAVYTSFYTSFMNENTLVDTYFTNFLRRGRDFKNFKQKLFYKYSYLVSSKIFKNPAYLYSVRFPYKLVEPQITFRTESSIDDFVLKEELKAAEEPSLVLEEVEEETINEPDYFLDEIWLLVCEMLVEYEKNEAENLQNWDDASNLSSHKEFELDDKIDITLPIKYYRYFLPHMCEPTPDSTIDAETNLNVLVELGIDDNLCKK